METNDHHDEPKVNPEVNPEVDPEAGAEESVLESDSPMGDLARRLQEDIRAVAAARPSIGYIQRTSEIGGVQELRPRDKSGRALPPEDIAGL